MLVSDLLLILKTIFTIFFFNDYFKRNYPNEYENFIVKLTMKILYIYSKFQIIFNKCFNVINSYIKQNKFNIFINVVKNEIYEIQNGDIHKKFSAPNVLEQFINYNLFDEFHNYLYIYSDNINPLEHNCINKVILNEKNLSLYYDISNIKFMLLEAIINNKAHKITLKSESYNYYIVDNVFDKKFFIYYLKNHNPDTLINEDLDSIKDKINIKLIDNNVNVRELEITDEKFILIKKDSYNY